MPEKVYDMEESCKRLKELCIEKGISVPNLAEKLGVSKQAVYAWINARKAPSIDHICEIADILQVSTEELLIRKSRNDKGV